ncbi:MFS transporter [Flavobacterium sp. DSR2-3-3]|uniref:MFS transporter n=1 Tax=Flavobacterium sp. DSR2-3-3 TaxID=2804632 RepID=UPI003CF30145
MNEKIKVLQIIHLAISAGTVIAYLFIGQLSIESLKIEFIDSSDLIYFAIPILAFFVSNFLFQSQLKHVDVKLKPEDNLPIYQTASIIRWAILEGSALFFLFLKQDLLILGILIIVYLLFLRPTEDRVISALSKAI